MMGRKHRTTATEKAFQRGFENGQQAQKQVSKVAFEEIVNALKALGILVVIS